MRRADYVRIHYRRLPDREQIFDQRVVLWRDDVIVTLAESTKLEKPIVVDGVTILEPGSSVVWFTFPGEWHDIGSFHRVDGRFTGFYANILTPPVIRGPTWWTTDLFLDVWLPTTGAAQLLDEDEFEEALSKETLDPDTAARARREADRIMEQVQASAWPPPIVLEWTLEQVSAVT